MAKSQLVFTFKEDEGCLVTELQKVSPLLIIVLGHFLTFAQKNNLPVVITNVGTTFHVSQSKTHIEGRAFDASVNGWNKLKISELIAYMEKSVGHLGAQSVSDGKQRVVVYHDAGLGYHLHFQVYRMDEK